MELASRSRNFSDCRDTLRSRCVVKLDCDRIRSFDRRILFFFPTTLLAFHTQAAACPPTGCFIASITEPDPQSLELFTASGSSIPGSESDILFRSSTAVCPSDGLDYPEPIGVRFSVISSSPPACSNSLDDDGDGKIDSADFGCTSASDTSEKDAAYVCDDGVDNDGDTFVDYPTDPGCAHGRAKKENPHCNDGLDNDGDNQIDFPFDTYCTAASASAETAPPPSGGGCGIGPELAALMPLLAWARRRRRALSS